jgi:hypothetical protein
MGGWNNSTLKKMNCELMLTYDTPALRHNGRRYLTGEKTLPTIWGTYIKLVTKYQISAINSYWEKCDEKYLERTEGRTEVKQYIPLPLAHSSSFFNCFSSKTSVYFYYKISVFQTSIVKGRYRNSYEYKNYYGSVLWKIMSGLFHFIYLGFDG